ncbi:MAG: hypothetical protein K2M43_00705 [Mycoplasmoidaceae bacterium]|nr:hypothetical protein [Mycoplasmoidaceae bacterium]
MSPRKPLLIVSFLQICFSNSKYLETSAFWSLLAFRYNLVISKVHCSSCKNESINK